MTESKKKRTAAVGGRANRFYTGGTYTVLIEMADIDPATNDDEATLEADDGSYKKTVKVADEGVRHDDDFLKLTFTGVIPGKEYTLTYDLKKDADGNELGEVIMFAGMLIDQEDMDNTRPVDYRPDPEIEDKGEFEIWKAGKLDPETVEIYEEPDPEQDDDKIFADEEKMTVEEVAAKYGEEDDDDKEETSAGDDTQSA